MASSVANVKIKKISEISGVSTVTGILDDLVAVEEPLEIRLTYSAAGQRKIKSISVTMRTPGNDFELALGFLFTEGIIGSIEDVTEIKYCVSDDGKQEKGNIVKVFLREGIEVNELLLQRNFYTASSCGICGKSSIEAIHVKTKEYAEAKNIVVSSSVINGLPEKLRKNQLVFSHTGGLHATAVFNENGSLLLMREDVGRHNALDKLIGAALAGHPDISLPLSDFILLLSGRISFELVQKAVSAGVKFIAAIGAPSSLAVELAKENGITLIGFLRDDRFNIYSGEERIPGKSKSR